jgi:hypothetical protein
VITRRYKYLHLKVMCAKGRNFRLDQLREAVTYFRSMPAHDLSYLMAVGAPVNAGDLLLGPQPHLKVHQIAGLTPREIWKEFDRQVDIARVHTALHSFLHGYSGGGGIDKIPGITSNDVPEEIKKRLQHFAALIWLGERINKYPPGTSPEVAAALDAELDPKHAYFAYAAAAQGNLYYLLK